MFFRFETDLDSSLYPADRLTEKGDQMPLVPVCNTSIYANSSAFHQPDPSPVDINEADERMKRYYGIIPKDKPAEIRTVRIVKRESEKRQRDKTRRYDDYLSSTGLEDVSEEDPRNGLNNDIDETIMNDPVLSQFSHVLTLPRRKKDDKDKQPALATGIGRVQRALPDAPNAGSRPQPTREDQWKEPLNVRRNTSSVSCINVSGLFA